MEFKEKKRKLSAANFAKLKAEGEKIAALSLYDAPTAKIAELCGIDLILVGDSLGMNLLGMPNTIAVKLEDIIRHSAAVRRGAPGTFVVADMPFMTYQPSIEIALKNAGRVLQESGCDAVKLEGGKEMAETIRRLVSAGIPVMAHIGLLPQKLLTLGGYRKVGVSAAEAEQLINDAKAVEEAGAFCVVLECVYESVAEEITAQLRIPTIGIGSGFACDGQIQVAHDVLGLLPDFAPKHAMRFANLADEIKNAFTKYCSVVKNPLAEK